MTTVGDLRQLLSDDSLPDEAPVLLYTSEPGGPQPFSEQYEASLDGVSITEVVETGYDRDLEVPTYGSRAEGAVSAEVILLKAVVIAID